MESWIHRSSLWIVVVVSTKTYEGGLAGGGKLGKMNAILMIAAEWTVCVVLWAAAAATAQISNSCFPSWIHNYAHHHRVRTGILAERRAVWLWNEMKKKKKRIRLILLLSYSSSVRVCIYVHRLRIRITHTTIPPYRKRRRKRSESETMTCSDESILFLFLCLPNFNVSPFYHGRMRRGFCVYVCLLYCVMFSPSFSLLFTYIFYFFYFFYFFSCSFSVTCDDVCPHLSLFSRSV